MIVAAYSLDCLNPICACIKTSNLLPSQMGNQAAVITLPKAASLAPYTAGGNRRIHALFSLQTLDISWERHCAIRLSNPPPCPVPPLKLFAR